MTAFWSYLRGFAGALAAIGFAFGLSAGPANAKNASAQNASAQNAGAKVVGAQNVDAHNEHAHKAVAKTPPSETQSPILVELFLSQSCTMCPPAVALFPEIAARDDVVALSWHVDYWNMTSSTHGRWDDPYSHPDFAKRQKRYNKNIRNKSSIYTPQIVVGGEHETVGGKKHKVEGLIHTTTRTGVTISSTLSRGGMLFEIDENENGGNAYLVTFKKQTVTPIASGPNKGKTFEETNVVTDIRPLGVVRRRGGELWVGAPNDGDSCALIVQEPGQKRVIAATYCPA